VGRDGSDVRQVGTGDRSQSGIGKALVEEALVRGAERVYAGTRQPFEYADPRVVPLILDVTDDAQIRATADAVPSLDLLINNAGLALRDDDLSDRALLERHLAVNFFGIFDVTLALLPALTESRGSVLNILSTASWVNLPLLPGYSVSKAAAFSLTQGLRAHLANRGVRVHAAMIGVVDTDMTKGFDGPKASSASVAARIFDGLDRREDEIFPDDVSAQVAEAWRRSPFKALEVELAAMVTGRTGVGHWPSRHDRIGRWQRRFLPTLTSVSRQILLCRSTARPARGLFRSARGDSRAGSCPRSGSLRQRVRRRAGGGGRGCPRCRRRRT
jgi:NAD(P)-dependent dehydrogenase (short-subunit alcohol dehydrogenase family)